MTFGDSPAAKAEAGETLLTKVGKFREVGLFAFIVLVMLFTQWKNRNFFTFENFDDLLANASILGILALGMMLVIVTRGIDLSIGANLALSGMIAALTVAEYRGLNPVFALLFGTVIGIACGAVVGLIVSYCGVLPIIASLGMMYVYRGLTYIVSGRRWVSASQMPDAFKDFATTRLFDIRVYIFIAAAFYLVFYYFTNHTRTGRRIYAVGSSPESAAISGLSAKRITWLVYVIMGGLSGFCGVLWVAKFASAQGDTASGYEMNVIAACVLGGVGINGGSGKVGGVLLGTLLLGALNNALPMINMSVFWQNAIQGAVILVAIIVNTLVKRNVDRTNLMRRPI
ncbi:MAG: ABC transporter permease [Planctomycetota bacterium]|jgi:rhamnose transport system permease protein|nr:ABC transporter permease [Planctomycetota bacterium]